MAARRSLVLALFLALAPLPLVAQEGGAVALAELTRGLGVTARVLVIAAHPDDEDTRLIAWLTRGRHVETAYLSLTRGDGGQNLIGNELGEGLGVIRSEELLAARRIDAGRQYFTRAYDFGFSRSAEETFRHWPRDELLRDVVTVVRAFRPHVIVSIFSGTPRDGHGQHQVAGIMAREAYEAAGDSTRFPAAQTGGHAPWTPLKLYTSRWGGGAAADATLSFNVGEYSHLLGRSYAEIAGESRSQHKSQGFGVLQRRGVVMANIRREHSRVNAPDPSDEGSIFDGLDISLDALRPLVTGADAPTLLAALSAATAAARDSIDPLRPATALEPLARVRAAVASLEARVGRDAANPDRRREALTILQRVDARAERAMIVALGAAVEPTAPHGVLAVGDTAPVAIAVYNRGPVPFTVDSVVLEGESVARAALAPRTVLPVDSVIAIALVARGTRVSDPWWLATARRGAMFAVPIDGRAEAEHRIAVVRVFVRHGDRSYSWSEPVVHRFADPVRGDVQQALAVVPAVSVGLQRTVEYAPVGDAITRTVTAQLRSGSPYERSVRVRIEVPSGLRADSVARTVVLRPFETRTLTFLLQGRAPAGRDSVRLIAESGGATFTRGWVPLEYEHIRSRQLYHPSTLALEGVPLRLPAGLRVAYIRGVGDNVLPALEQLGIEVTPLEPSQIPGTDLARFSTIVIGPRAYAASDDLVRHNHLLLEFVRGGGTMVVQYGQYEMMRAGMMPYPVTILRPHTRVTDEQAPVTMLDPQHRLLRAPNAIGPTDFDGWVQERALYMPAEFGDAYTALLAMSDEGQPANRGAILVARYGEGTYIYTSLAFFRQLPAGVPGAARLFVNLLAPDGRNDTRAVTR